MKKILSMLLTALVALPGCPGTPFIRGMPAYDQRVTGLASDCGKGATAFLITDEHPLAGAERHWVEQAEGDGEAVEELYHGDEDDRLLKVGPWKCFFRHSVWLGELASTVREAECWAFEKPNCRARINLQKLRPSSRNEVPLDPSYSLDGPVVPTSELMDGSLEEAQRRELEVRGLEL